MVNLVESQRPLHLDVIQGPPLHGLPVIQWHRIFSALQQFEHHNESTWARFPVVSEIAVAGICVLVLARVPATLGF